MKRKMTNFASKTGFTRRDLLKALGVSAAAAPFIPSFERQAEAAGFPQRLLLVFSPMGLPRYYWPTGSETDFKLGAGTILEPLKGFEGDLIIPKGIKRDWDPVHPDEHEKGIACMFTGAKLNTGADGTGNGFASGPSIDQIIAKAVKPDTRFESLQIAVQSDGAPAGKSETMRYMSYAGNNQPIPNENSPYKLFDKLMGGNTGRPAAELAAVRARRQSVIDNVRAEIGDLQKKLGAAEKMKLDGHLESVRAIEARLQQGGDERMACGGIKPDGTIDLKANDNFPTLLKLHVDLIVAALACDASRFITWQMGKAYSVVTHRWAGVTGEHHAISHDETANGDVQNAKILTWFSKQLAYLLGELKKVKEGPGTLLDNMLVVNGYECADAGAHVPNPGLVQIAGRLGGKVKTGRFPDYKDQVNWTQMLVSICHLMGAPDVQKVGNLGPGGPANQIFTG